MVQLWARLARAERSDGLTITPMNGAEPGPNVVPDRETARVQRLSEYRSHLSRHHLDKGICRHGSVPGKPIVNVQPLPVPSLQARPAQCEVAQGQAGGRDPQSRDLDPSHLGGFWE
jgi:hypothetical protein